MAYYQDRWLHGLDSLERSVKVQVGSRVDSSTFIEVE